MNMNTTLDRVPVGTIISIFDGEGLYKVLSYSPEWKLWVLRKLRTGKDIYADAFRCKVIENSTEEGDVSREGPLPILQKLV
jgi:hypothetical protein